MRNSDDVYELDIKIQEDSIKHAKVYDSVDRDNTSFAINFAF